MFWDIDDCQGVDCNDTGTCVDKILGYTCMCFEGYEGTNCEIGKQSSLKFYFFIHVFCIFW